MNKKQMTFVIVLNAFLVLIGGIIIRSITSYTLKSFSNSVESNMGTKVNDIKKSNFSALQSYLIQTIATAKQSVVNITASKDVKFYVDDPSQLYGPGTIQQQIAKIGGGSGIIISKKGYIITNKHIVQDTTAKYSVILADGRTYNVDKIRFDDLLDLAILKIMDSETKTPSDLSVATFLPMDKQVHIGQFALIIGNAFSKYPNTVTMGIIGGRSKKLTINGNNLYIGLYQTDAHANPGNSGGPLIDIDGNTIGITTAIDEGEGMTFALPLSKEFIDGTLKSIETFGKISRPVIGIQYTELPSSLIKEKKLGTNEGILIKDVLTDLPAWKAGLKVNDIILTINGRPITNQLPFLYQLYTALPGDTITLGILRGTETMNVEVILGGNIQ